MNNKIIILAGGDGTRLFPFSTKERPKYLLPLCSSLPMISEAFLLAKDCVGAENVYIVTTEERAYDIQKCIRAVWNPEVTNSFPRVILEKPNGTFYSVILSSLAIAIDVKTYDFNMLIMPADANFKDRPSFLKNIREAFKMLEENNGKHVLFGIEPSEPTDKFGYITWKGFVEKPSPEYAKELIECGALWNMGFLGMNAKTFLDESSIYQNEKIKLNIQNSQEDFFSNIVNFSTFVQEGDFKKISIDYAYLNKLNSEKFSVLKFESGSWSDMGSIEELVNSNDASEFVDIINVEGGGVIIMEKGDAVDSFDAFNLNSDQVLLVSGNNKRIIKK